MEMRRYLFSASSPFLSRVSYIRIEKRHRRYVNNNEDRLSYNTYDMYIYSNCANIDVHPVPWADLVEWAGL